MFFLLLNLRVLALMLPQGVLPDAVGEWVLDLFFTATSESSRWGLLPDIAVALLGLLEPFTRSLPRQLSIKLVC